MKKRHLLITTLSTSLLIGSVAAIVFNSNNKTKGADASSLSPTSGTFQRIKNYSDLVSSVGSKVIIVSDDGQAMDDVWGNPGYVHGGGDGVALSEDLDTVTLTNSKATIFTLETGTETAMFGLNELQSFAFKADTMCITGQRKSNIYFAHNEKEYYGDSTFENIGYFKDHDIAVEVSKKTESSWFVEFSLDEDDWDETVLHTHIRNAKSVKAGDYDSEVLFTYRYAPRFCSNDGTNINIYKAYDPSLYSITVDHLPDKTDYQLGESIDLTGLVIGIHTSLGEESVSYTSSPDSFTYSSTAYGNGEVLFPISYNSMRFVIKINVSKPSYSAIKIGQLADYRGSYMLVEEYGYAFDGDAAESSPATCKYRIDYDYENRLFQAKDSSDYEDLRFVLTKDNDGFHLKNRNNKYLNLDSFSLTNASATVVIEHTADGENVKSTSGKYLCFDFYLYEFAVATQSQIDDDTDDNDYHKVVLCKYTLSSDEQTALDTYIANFISVTNVCDETGATFSITQSNWTSLASGFNALSGTVQAEIVNTTYTIDDPLSTDLQFAMSRYDYIYSKYHDSQTYTYITDFIGRYSAGTMQNLYHSAVISPLYNLTNNNIVPIIIVVVVVVSLSSFGAFLLIKRKNH